MIGRRGVESNDRFMEIRRRLTRALSRLLGPLTFVWRLPVVMKNSFERRPAEFISRVISFYGASHDALLIANSLPRASPKRQGQTQDFTIVRGTLSFSSNFIAMLETVRIVSDGGRR